MPRGETQEILRSPSFPLPAGLTSHKFLSTGIPRMTCPSYAAGRSRIILPPRLRLPRFRGFLARRPRHTRGSWLAAAGVRPKIRRADAVRHVNGEGGIRFQLRLRLRRTSRGACGFRFANPSGVEPAGRPLRGRGVFKSRPLECRVDWHVDRDAQSGRCQAC